MKRAVFFLLVVAVFFAAACSKSSPEAVSGKTEAAATQVDFKKICERLVPLALEAHRETFAQTTCEAKYQGYLQACRNGAAVTECFLKIKSWDERLACIDSCVRNTAAAK